MLITGCVFSAKGSFLVFMLSNEHPLPCRVKARKGSDTGSIEVGLTTCLGGKYSVVPHVELQSTSLIMM